MSASFSDIGVKLGGPIVKRRRKRPFELLKATRKPADEARFALSQPYPKWKERPRLDISLAIADPWRLRQVKRKARKKTS